MSGCDRFFVARAGAVFGLAFLLAGCTRMSDLGFDAQSTFGSVSFVDRCADFMHRAFPDSAIKVGDTHVEAEMDRATVTVAATRTGVPEGGPYARDIGVECRFESGVLTGFRWTKGPLRP